MSEAEVTISTVARLLARGTGPARARARLRDQTRGVIDAAARLSAEQSKRDRLIETPVPASVLGGDLISLLSAPLQALLRGEAPGPAPDESAPRTGTHSGLDASASRRRRKLAGHADGVVPRTHRGTSGSGPNGKRQPERAAERDHTPALPGDQTARVPDLVGRPATPAPLAAGGVPVNADQVSRAEPRNGASETRRSTAAPLLARQVAAYFQLPVSSAQGGAETSEPRPAPAPPGGSARPAAFPTNGAATTSAGPSLGRDWPALTAQQLADRLHRFVTDGVPPDPGQITATPSEGQQVEISNTFHIQVGSAAARGGDAAQADLSDQVAEILRQQAIQHGIDVT